jgi:hypothetical protein
MHFIKPPAFPLYLWFIICSLMLSFCTCPFLYQCFLIFENLPHLFLIYIFMPFPTLHSCVLTVLCLLYTELPCVSGSFMIFLKPLYTKGAMLTPQELDTNPHCALCSVHCFLVVAADDMLGLMSSWVHDTISSNKGNAN